MKSVVALVRVCLSIFPTINPTTTPSILWTRVVHTYISVRRKRVVIFWFSRNRFSRRHSHTRVLAFTRIQIYARSHIHTHVAKCWVNVFYQCTHSVREFECSCVCVWECVSCEPFPMWSHFNQQTHPVQELAFCRSWLWDLCTIPIGDLIWTNKVTFKFSS